MLILTNVADLLILIADITSFLNALTGSHRPTHFALQLTGDRANHICKGYEASLCYKTLVLAKSSSPLKSGKPFEIPASPTGKFIPSTLFSWKILAFQQSNNASDNDLPVPTRPQASIDPPTPQRTATLPYDLGDDRTPFIVEREAKLSQDVKEINALLDRAQRLLQRIESDGTNVLNWLPNVLRHLLHTRIVGPVPAASENSYFGPEASNIPGIDSDNQRDAVLRVLVMLEILDWGTEVLDDAEARARAASRGALSESARKRILQGELIRISVSSEDLQDVLEQELRDLRAYRERLRSARNRSPLSPTEMFIGQNVATTSYAHPLLDRSVPPTDARHSTRPDLSWVQTTLAPSVLTRSRQRAHSFPLALGLLARCVIMGTITPRRMRTRARSLDDLLSPNQFRC